MYRMILGALVCSLCVFAQSLKDFKPYSESVRRVVLNETFDKPLSTLELKKGFTIEKTGGVQNGACLKFTRKIGEPYLYLSASVPGMKPGYTYYFTADVKAKGVRNEEGSLITFDRLPVSGMDFWTKDTWAGDRWGYMTTKEGASDWQKISCEAILPPGAEGKVIFFLLKEYACEEIRWDNVRIEEGKALPPIVYPIVPKRLNLDEKGTVKLKLYEEVRGCPQGRLVFATGHSIKEHKTPVREDNTADFQFGKLPKGEHSIMFHVCDKESKQVITEETYTFVVE